jgi:hypothetical protein
MSRLLTAACVMVLLLTSACAEPPTKERHQAETALADARKAGAETYAPEDLQAAEAALQKYDGAVAQRDYRQALSFAQDARDQAYAAAKRATTEKAAAMAHATQLIGDIEALTKGANARLSGTGAGGPRLTAPAAERLRAALRGGGVALQEARSLFDQQDFRGAVLRATPAVEAFRREVSPGDVAPGRRGR